MADSADAPLDLVCRCGGIGLRITGAPLAQAYCHCEDCRAATGGAYVAASIYPAPALQVTRGEPVAMKVRETPRLRCPDCQTLLFSDLQAFGLRSLNGFLLPAELFKPQSHVQCEAAVMPVRDGLPHFKRFPAAMGGSDELVDW